MLLYLGCATGCRSSLPSLQGEQFELPMLTEMGTMQNVAVCGDLWMGSMPTPEDLELAKRRGITQVIDLRAKSERELLMPESPDTGLETSDEMRLVSKSTGISLAAMCKQLGMDCISMKLQDRSEIVSERVVDEVVTLLGEAQREGRKTLLVSPEGRRSALLFAVHRVVNEGLPLELAALEVRRTGVNTSSCDKFLREQVERKRPALAPGK